MSAKNHWLAGMGMVVPIIMGYVPVGVAFGALAYKAGLSPANIILMSAMVYGGASQLIAVGLIAAGASPISIIITTLIVNLRHFIMTSSIAPYLKGWTLPELAVFCGELTDETFALHSTAFMSNPPVKATVFIANITAHGIWVTGTILGLVAGRFITDVKPLALDYALPALFVALLAFQVKERLHLIVAILSGLVAVVLTVTDLARLNVIIAAPLAALAGVIIESWIKKPSSSLS